MDAEHVTCDEAIQIADEAVDRCADGYDAKLRTISALVEGLHAQLFGIASLNDPVASHEAIADNGVIHEAVHALVRELPSLKRTRPTADLGEDGGLIAKLRQVDSDDIGGGLAHNWHRNPDGPEAADRLILYREALAPFGREAGDWDLGDVHRARAVLSRSGG